MGARHLSGLLIRSDEYHAGAPQVRNVLLASRLAHHSACGWDNAAIPDDVRHAALLNLGQGPAFELVQDIDA